MEDDAGPVLVEDLTQLDGVAYVGDDGRRRPEPALADELALDLEEVGLGVVEEHELAGSTRAIWRQSSEPIEPPAPVTSTTSPFR